LESRRHHLRVQTLFHFRFWLSAILNFGSLPSSTNVDQCRQMSGVSTVSSKSNVVENAGGSLWNRVANSYLQNLFLFPVWWPAYESVVNNVGRHRRHHDQVGRGRKCGGSRWNNVCMFRELKLLDQQKISDFPWMVPLVFQVGSSTGRAIFMRKMS